MSTIFDSITVTGTGALNTTISNAAAVDLGRTGPREENIVKIPVAANIFSAGSHLYIEGTTNYNGLRNVYAVSSGFIHIYAKYTAETFAGTETVKVAIKPKGPYEFMGISIHLGAAPATSENITVTVDADAGSAFDVVADNANLQSLADHATPKENHKVCSAKDVLRVAWSNTDLKTYGLKLLFKMLCVCAMILFSADVYAAGSGTCTLSLQATPQDAKAIQLLTITWTGDASNGSVPTITCPAISGFVILGVTDPGSTAPTTLYDVNMYDSDSGPVFGGAMADRSATASEQAMPLVGGTYGPRWINGATTVTVTNNSVNSATGTIKIYAVR